MTTFLKMVFPVTLVAGLFATASLALAGPPHDAGWKIRGMKDLERRTYSYESPAYYAPSATVPAAPSTDNSAGNVAPSQPAQPSMPQATVTPPSIARRSFSYEPAPQTRSYSQGSRRSSRPQWSIQKMLRNN